MEQLAYQYQTSQPINKRVHVGVVGSGDLEILMFPTNKAESTVKVCTGSDGFDEVWGNVLTRFFDRYPISADIVINDFGATPGVVYLRLTQAMEELADEK
ncbi:malonate decarboxylase subunit delta [Latilactobacillus sp. 5-91]|uniref:Malonate decarboxylase acyl carrier protein n=1 Tax=Latilactobacillus sakei TaxID=1599 RepID=A0AAF0K398_LATSK|nr:malonate decarboxylase subunit delta [Latilactobacillus sakei]EOR84880.1 malonate decarboxylase delta subunit [Latilactobacillus sakei subsp. sakei LS25]MCP8851350.1 malonate decarboxylase subunit delta [Latilactobacillus sakei]MDH0601411.1 malonate decarboxylase subunit delta [Latilactobacillus sakei]MDM5044191.1 malonate decarboxylase subunit delta [Latilactobacillus sakei]PKX64101.1 malonate decarboxylase acyl carrier protein [Latilactobacillus sakei]